MTVAYPLLLVFMLAWLFMLFGSAYACGSWFMKKAGFPLERPARDGVLAVGIGLAVFSYAIFTMAALGWVSIVSLLVVHGVWSLWLLPGLVGMIAGKSRSQEGEKPAEEKSGKRWHQNQLVYGWVIFVFAALLNAIPAWVPETGWDGLAYHLALPKLYLQAGGFVFRPDIFHNLFPQFTEMFYLAAMVFPFGMAAKGVHHLMGCLTVFGLVALGDTLKLRRAGLLAGLVFYVQYLVHMESTTAFIDLTVAAYAILGVVAMVRYWQSRSRLFFYLAGFFWGVVAANKWHGMLVLLLGGGILTIQLWTDQRISMAGKLKRSAWVLLWGSLPVVPYGVRAWIMGKNPVWPLAYSIFGGTYWDATHAKLIRDFVAAYAGLQHGWVGLLRLPYDLVVHGQAFGLGGAELRWPLVGLVFCAACAVLFLRPFGLQSGKKVGVLSWTWTVPISIVAFIILWFFSSPQIRFLLPLLPMAAWVAGWVLDALWEQRYTTQRWLAVFIGLLFVLFHPPLHHDTLEQIRVLSGQIAPDAYCAKKLEHYPASMFLNRHMQSGEKVLLFGENRGFYLDGAYVWGDPLLQKFVDYRHLGSVDALAKDLQSKGVVWVLFRKDLYQDDYLDPASIAMVEGLLASIGEKKFENGPVAVYKLYMEGQLARSNGMLDHDQPL